MLGHEWRSLRVKIIAWSFIPASIILTAVALVSFYAYQRVAEDLVLGRNQELARLSASSLSSEMRQYSDLLASAARTADIYRGEPVMQRSALARLRNRLVVFDGGVVLLDRTGTVTAAEPDRNDLLGQNWSNRSYYSQMLRTVSPVYSDIVSDGPGGSKVLVTAVPVTGEQGDFQGVLAGMFRLGASSVSAFYGGIVKLRIDDNGMSMLLDSTGKVIYHSNPDLIGADLSNDGIVKQFLGRKVTQLNGGTQGASAVASFSPVPGTPWGLVTEESWDALMKPSQSYRQFLILLLVMGVVVPALVVTIGVRRVTGPIIQLTHAAREVAGGNFGRTAEVQTGDELEDLANQFNAMSGQLKDSYANLERKVADRTRELAALNSIAAVVSESLDLDEVLHAAMDKTLEVLELAQGGIYLLDEKKGDLSLAIHRGLGANALERIGRLKLGEGFSGEVAETGEPLVIRDAASDPRLRLAPGTIGEGVSIASVPLVSSGRRLGALFVMSDGKRDFSLQDVQLLSSIGQQIGVAVENARLYEQAKQVAVLDERNRLARDLHDSVTQAVYSVTLYAEAASRLLAAGQVEVVAEHLSELQVSAQQALREMRSLIFELRPSLLEKEGLAAALHSRLDAVERRAGLQVEFSAEGVSSIPANVENGLYGLSQEALNNILKHSRARNVCLHLVQFEDKLVMEIADDGTGFDLAEARERGGLGLKGMAERAVTFGGELTIESSPGNGTKVRVEVEL